MLKDITLGQYFPLDSVVHRMDARFKIIITMLYLVMLFWGQHVISLIAGFVFLILALICSKIPPKMPVRSIKPILPVLIFTGTLNFFAMKGGTLRSPLIYGDMYPEVYTYDHRRSTKMLRGICQQFAQFLNNNRDLITDRKIFGGEKT